MSALKLREFIGQVKNGGVAKSNQYFIEITPPPAIGQSDPFKSNLNMISLFCDKTEIPGVTIESAPVRSYGESRESAYGKIYDQVQLTFYVDANFIVKEFFDTWINAVFDTETRHIGYPAQYTADTLKIYVQDSQNESRYTVTLHKVWPKNIGSIEIGYATSGVMKLNVTLAYQWSTFERFGATEFKKQSFIDGIKSNGSMAQAKQTSGNFDYGFGGTSIPTDYFTKFESFQTNMSNTGSSSIDLGEESGT